MIYFSQQISCEVVVKWKKIKTMYAKIVSFLSNTTLNAEKNVHEMTSFVLDDIAKYDSNKLITFMEK